MYKQNPKSPVLKALKGNQGKLPQHLQDAIKAAPESPAQQTTAGEFAHKQSIKDKEMGKSTKAVDKVKAAYDAMTTDKTYAEAKKGYRKAAKKAYEVKPPAPIKQTNAQKAKSMEASKEKKVSVAAGASKGKASTNRVYVKGGRKKESGSREKSKTTEFNTFDGGKTYTKTTTKGKQGKVKVKTKEISGTKAKRQADRLNKKYAQV